MIIKKRKTIIITVISLFCFILILSVSIKTKFDLKAVPDSLRLLLTDINQCQAIDRHGTPLSITYQNRWNSYDFIALHDIPQFMQNSFILSEDKRFYNHNGIDLAARLHALWQNIKALSAVRGASTISEQVIRLIHPRPRTLWSRWLEGFEAIGLEKKTTKKDILEFYLNQIPYASNRRGVVQASKFYFNRGVDTLSQKEMLALSVLIRAPSYLDLYKSQSNIAPFVSNLAKKMQSKGLLTDEELKHIQNSGFYLEKSKLAVYAGHFVNYVFSHNYKDFAHKDHVLKTTLDSEIQKFSQQILDQRLIALKPYKVTNGALLVVDHTTNNVLAWVNGQNRNPDIPGSMIDAVTALRQPGSSLKPFLYASALELGWTAAHLLMDQPLMVKTGHGIHEYHNYSRIFYGPVSLREALGNSLNIPAVCTIQFIGVARYLSKLRLLGFNNLLKHPDIYGDGLALGNGEVSLFELVHAYTALANKGSLSPLKTVKNQYFSRGSRQIFSKEITSIISNILSDPDARYLEFGAGSLLDFPVQTALKTGTSSDYRDAWAVGYNYKYTVGVWMGNLDSTAMDGISGARGPAMVLRSIFTELNRFSRTKPLYQSPQLVQKEICDPAIKLRSGNCVRITELFKAGSDEQAGQGKEKANGGRIDFIRPRDGIELAMDPRIPDNKEAFEFFLKGVKNDAMVAWTINNKNREKTVGPKYLWSLKKGVHEVKAVVYNDSKEIFKTRTICFTVK